MIIKNKKTIPVIGFVKIMIRYGDKLATL